MPWFSGGFSLSKTWKVARLTSEISSSVRISRRALSCDATFVAGAVADAAPVIARETPAAPNAKAAFLAKAAFPRFRLELRFAFVMVEPARRRFDQATRTKFSALRHEPARCRFGSPLTKRVKTPWVSVAAAVLDPKEKLPAASYRTGSVNPAKRINSNSSALKSLAW